MYTLYIFTSILLNITYIVNALYHALGDIENIKSWQRLYSYTHQFKCDSHCPKQHV
jgi:hypothetical protein